MPTIVTDPKVLAAKYNHAFNSYDEAALGYTNGWMRALPDAKIHATHEIVSGPWASACRSLVARTTSVLRAACTSMWSSFFRSSA